MNGKKPSRLGTGLILVLGAISAVDAIGGVAGHGRTFGFSQLELGLVIALALCSVALIILGLIERPGWDDHLPWWGVALIVIAAIAVFAVGDLLEHRFFRDDPRVASLMGTSRDFLGGGALLGWAISRLRKARAIDRGSGPDPARQDTVAGQ
jgi:hypothetical protein